MYPRTLCATSRVTNILQAGCSGNQWRTQKFSYNNARSTWIDPTSLNSHGGNSCLKTLVLLSFRPLHLTTTKIGSRDSLVVRAVSIPENTDGGPEAKSSSLARLLQLGGMFCLWYLLNVYFNIYNKQVLNLSSTIISFMYGNSIDYLWVIRTNITPISNTWSVCKHNRRKGISKFIICLIVL